MDLDRTISANIKAARINAGKTQYICGVALGVSTQQYQKYENGINRLSAGALVILCRTLNIRLEDAVKGIATESDEKASRHVLEFARLPAEHQKAIMKLYRSSSLFSKKKGRK